MQPRMDLKFEVGTAWIVALWLLNVEGVARQRV
jgi:hypothetical protein